MPEKGYRVAYYQSQPGDGGTTEEMDLTSANAEAARLQSEGYITQIINPSGEEPEDAVDL